MGGDPGCLRGGRGVCVDRGRGLLGTADLREERG